MKFWVNLFCCTVTAFILGACGRHSNSASKQITKAKPSAPAKKMGTLSDFLKMNFTLIWPSKSVASYQDGWRDASGTFWHMSMLVDVSPNQLVTNDPCASEGLRAPTIKQLHQLAIYLGRGSTFGFHPEALQKVFNLDIGWGSFKHVLLIGIGSLFRVGIGGVDGATGELTLDTGVGLGNMTGYPNNYDPTAPYNPWQTDFATICVSN